MSDENLTSDFPTPADKERVIGHMNDDHSDAVLAYVQAFFGKRDAANARMVDFDRDGITIEYRTRSDIDTCRVPFPARVASREELRAALVDMANRARAKLGAGAAATTH